MSDVQVINYISNNIKEAVSVFYLKSLNKVWEITIDDNGQILTKEILI